MEYLQNCAVSTCPRSSPEISRRRHRLPSKKHYELLDRILVPYRREMKLYYEQSLPIADIAKQLKLSESAVKAHLARGREHLEDIYARNVGEGAA